MFLSINNSSWQWSRTLCRNTGSLGNVVPKETAPKVFKVERAPSLVLFSRTKPRRRADGHQQMWSSLQHRAGFRSFIEAAPSCLQIIIHVTQKCNCNLIWCRENMKTDYQNFEQLVWIAALCLQVVSSHIRTFKEKNHSFSSRRWERWSSEKELLLSARRGLAFPPEPQVFA